MSQGRTMISYDFLDGKGMRIFSVFLVLSFLFTASVALAESQLLQEENDIYAVIKDAQGNRLEGYLQGYPTEITVSTKDHQ